MAPTIATTANADRMPIFILAAPLTLILFSGCPGTDEVESGLDDTVDTLVAY